MKVNKTIPKYRLTLSSRALQMVHAYLCTRLESLSVMDTEYGTVKEAYLSVGRAMLTAQVMPERAAYTASSTHKSTLEESLGLGMNELGSVAESRNNESELDKLNRMTEEEKAEYNQKWIDALTNGTEMPTL